MKKKLLVVIYFVFLISCSNLFEQLADKDADEALLFDAQEAVNAQNYDGAIQILTQELSAGAQLKEQAREILASAYAGKCGLNFIEYVDGLAAATSGSAFELASAPFVGVAVDPDYCLQSLETVELIGPTETRSEDQNAFASIVGMVLMGARTRISTDNVPANGDGIEDAPSVSCGLSDNEIDQIVLGYGFMSKNFSALASQIGSSSGATFADSISTCQSVAGASCEITDAADITPMIRDTMKDLLNTTEYGVGVADGSNPALIPAACP